jgi:hypothetical protein
VDCCFSAANIVHMMCTVLVGALWLPWHAVMATWLLVVKIVMAGLIISSDCLHTMYRYRWLVTVLIKASPSSYGKASMHCCRKPGGEARALYLAFGRL